MPQVPQLPAVTQGVYPTSSVAALVAAQAFLLTPPKCELAQIVAQTFTTATPAPVTFTSEIVDTDYLGLGMHDNVTNNTRVTANYPGWYLCSGSVSFPANATGTRQAWLRVNGIDVAASAGSVPSSAANVIVVHSRTKLIPLNIGDYVELIGYQESGGNLTSFVSTATFESALTVIWKSN